MKFVVIRESYGNTVDVRLHWESKDKIKKVLYYGFLGATTAAAALYYVNNKPADETE